MKSEYRSEDLLPLSGIQHFLFCRRQWALMYLERQWQDNLLTLEGKQLHQKADDPFFDESRRDLIIARSVPVASYRLGLNGICDLVEFVENAQGVTLGARQGHYLATPVEYKRGHVKTDACDEAQLCAQAICLEEMLAINIPVGYLYYGETRHRVAVELHSELRKLVQEMADEMHAYFSSGYTPRVRTSKACRSCSLAGICLPVLMEKNIPASDYIRQQIETG